MEIQSRHLADVAGGVELHTTLDGEHQRLRRDGRHRSQRDRRDRPREKVEAGADIHAANVDNIDNAQDQIDQVLENMNPGDVAVFLCSDTDAFGAALDLLGLPIDE